MSGLAASKAVDQPLRSQDARLDVAREHLQRDLFAGVAGFLGGSGARFVGWSAGGVGCVSRLRCLRLGIIVAACGDDERRRDQEQRRASHQ